MPVSKISDAPVPSSARSPSITNAISSPVAVKSNAASASRMVAMSPNGTSIAPTATSVSSASRNGTPSSIPRRSASVAARSSIDAPLRVDALNPTVAVASISTPVGPSTNVPSRSASIAAVMSENPPVIDARPPSPGRSAPPANPSARISASSTTAPTFRFRSPSVIGPRSSGVTSKGSTESTDAENEIARSPGDDEGVITSAPICSTGSNGSPAKPVMSTVPSTAMANCDRSTTRPSSSMLVNASVSVVTSTGIRPARPIDCTMPSG